MPSNTAASMFGGAGGRGSRASVSSLEGLRNAPADDKQTLRGLNDRLSGYLGRVRHLEKENSELQKEIDEILAKRKAPEGRNWDDTEKPLEDLKNQIKDITMDNAKLLLQIDNAKLADEDFKNKLADETKARKELEKDVEELKKTIDDTKLNCKQTQKEIDLVKEELARLEKEHKDVDVLREKIKHSEVKVEIDSQNSNLAEMLNKIRNQYDKLAKKNLKETEEWYQSKFENIKVAEAQNNEAMLTGKVEMKELLKQKQSLEIKIQSLHTMIRNLEETFAGTKVEYSQRLAPLNKAILNLEAGLREVRSQVERHVETNNNLLCVKMKLEAEIDNYHLLDGCTRMKFGFISLPDQQKPENEVPELQEAVEEEALLKQQNGPANQSCPPKEPGDPAEAEEVKARKAQSNGPAKKKKKSKNKDSSSSSSSSSSFSSSWDEDEKPKNEGKEAKA
uniref:IF rod domain-containing protein n=1 Tax=Mola mola TaxID=94237 RepID=A0A3Q3WFY8_MOLML